jgi:hypothetical protein
MSENGMNDGSGLSTTAPGISGGKNALPSSGLAPVKVTVQPGQTLDIPETDISNVQRTMLPSTVTSSARLRESGSTVSFDYTGNNLVNKSGAIARPQYDPNTEAYTYIAKMDTTERLDFLNKLYSRGLYNGSKPSTTGFASKDVGAVQDFMLYANSKRATGDVALSLLLSEFGNVGGAKAIRTTAKQDIRSVFKDATRRLLGRDVTDDQIEKFVKAYEGKEITEAKGGVKAPSLQTAAEVQVEQQFGGEAKAIGMANLMDLMDKKIKGLA